MKSKNSLRYDLFVKLNIIYGFQVLLLQEKKNGQIQVCLDFRDLNNVCLKDEFSLPISEMMIDFTTGYEVISFIDCSFGYNQICIAAKYKELTMYRLPKGNYYYNVMSFGLKNVATTYQGY